MNSTLGNEASCVDPQETGSMGPLQTLTPFCVFRGSWGLNSYLTRHGPV